MQYIIKLYFILIILLFSACAGPKVPMTPQQEAATLYASASQSQDLEQYEKANLQFGEFIKKFPESNSADNALLNIANGYYQQGKYDQAISAYQEILEKYPNSDTSDHALIFIGDTYLAQQKYSESIEAYNKVLQKYPRFGKQIAISARDSINAVKDIQEDLKILQNGKEEEKDNAQYDIADKYFAVFKDYEHAKSEFQAVVDKWPKSELADDALWKVGECYYNIATKELPSRVFTQEQLAYIRLMEIYERYPQLTKIRLFHLDVHWPVPKVDPNEYSVSFTETRRIVNKYPGIQDKNPIDYAPENYRKAFEKWQEVISIYSNTDIATEAPAKVAQAYVDLGNLYYNIGQKHFACLFFMESLATMPNPPAHLAMARYYGNITSIAAPSWAYRRAFYHISKAAELTPPDSPMADKVSWAKEWMNYKMRIEGLENWPDKSSRR